VVVRDPLCTRGRLSPVDGSMVGHINGTNPCEADRLDYGGVSQTVVQNCNGEEAVRCTQELLRNHGSSR
jgi:hypothetical protein